MAKVLVHANVAFPDELLAAIELHDRKPHGELSCSVEMDEDAHNMFYISFSWSSVEAAKAFWGSEAGIAQLDSWRSVSKPIVLYLRNIHGE